MTIYTIVNVIAGQEFQIDVPDTGSPGGNAWRDAARNAFALEFGYDDAQGAEEEADWRFDELEALVDGERICLGE